MNILLHNVSKKKKKEKETNKKKTTELRKMCELEALTLTWVFFTEQNTCYPFLHAFFP